MARDIKAQKLMAAHAAAGFFLELTEDMDDGVFLGALGAIFMTRAGDAKKALDLLVRLGSALTDGAKKGEL